MCLPENAVEDEAALQVCAPCCIKDLLCHRLDDHPVIQNGMNSFVRRTLPVPSKHQLFANVLCALICPLTSYKPLTLQYVNAV